MILRVSPCLYWSCSSRLLCNGPSMLYGGQGRCPALYIQQSTLYCTGLYNLLQNSSIQYTALHILYFSSTAFVFLWPVLLLLLWRVNHSNRWQEGVWQFARKWQNSVCGHCQTYFTNFLSFVCWLISALITANVPPLGDTRGLQVIGMWLIITAGSLIPLHTVVIGETMTSGFWVLKCWNVVEIYS